MYWKVTSVSPLDGYELLLTFEGGEQRRFDMKPYLDVGPVFRALKDPAMFATVRVCADSIAWQNRADIAPETLYHESTKV